MAQVNLGRVVGYSAYEIAVQNGFVGTEAEWLASLKGDTGATGAQGPQGLTGPQGAQGPKGDKGDTGATGATGAQGAQGIQGPVGPAGPQGETGPQGPAGPAGASTWSGISDKPFSTIGTGLTVSEGVLSADSQTFTESDPIFTASPAYSITASDISDWNAKQDALSAGANITISGNEISATFTESEPLFSGSAASTITTSDISVWNAKQNALTAGTGITISGDVISADGGSSSVDFVEVADIQHITVAEQAELLANWAPKEIRSTVSNKTYIYSLEFVDNASIPSSSIAVYKLMMDRPSIFNKYNPFQRYYTLYNRNGVVDDAMASASALYFPNPVGNASNGDVLTYNANSENLAWSQPSNGLPTIASGDAGKALVVNSLEDGVEWGAITFTESDPVFGASAAASITASDISAWNAKQDALTAGSNITISGNTISAAFTFTESDPVFGASPAASITASDISAWNAIVGVPSASSASEGDVLTIDRGGDPVWAAPQSGSEYTDEDTAAYIADTFGMSDDGEGNITPLDRQFIPEIIAQSEVPAEPALDDEYYETKIYDSVVNGIDYKYNDSDEWEEVRSFELGTGGLSFTNGSVNGDLGMDDTTGAILWNGDEIAMKNDITSVPTYSYANLGQVLGIQADDRGLRAPAQVELAWVDLPEDELPSYDSSTIGKVLGVQQQDLRSPGVVAELAWVDKPESIPDYSRAAEGDVLSINRGGEMEWMPAASGGGDVEESDIEEAPTADGEHGEVQSYTAPATRAFSLDFTHENYESIDSGDVDEHDNPVYEWQRVEYSRSVLDSDNLTFNWSDETTGEGEDLSINSGGLEFTVTEVEEVPGEEGEDPTFQPITNTYTWNKEGIQLKDATTGEIYQLSISNGQIVLSNLSL